MRLFVGVELPEPLRDQLAQALEPLRARHALPAGVRVLGAETWHVTLQFLGSTPDELVPRLIEACSAALAACPSFEAQLAGTGAFPTPKRARALWVGLAPGEAQLAQLAHAIHGATEPLGFAPEHRPFRAHITWARAKPERDVRELLETLSAAPWPERRARVREVTLFRSHLSSEGARYEALARMPLGSSDALGSAAS